MTFRHSLNSTSTCVNSPTDTLPLTADLYIKCQDWISYKDSEAGALTSEGNATEISDSDDGHGIDQDHSDYDLDLDLEYEDEEGFVSEGDDTYEEDNQQEPVLVGEQDSFTEKEVDMVPWLQEAIQTVSVLETRLMELEEDCQAIPLYEQDRAQMIQLIQELDTIVQQDQAWIENAESAVCWTSFALEEALLSSARTTTRDRYRKLVIEGREPGSATIASGRKSISEGMMPSSADPTQINARQSQEGQELEEVYRNAIMTALRHLKTVEHLQSIKSGIRRDSSRGNARIVATADIKRMSPNLALQDWLDNASMMSLERDDGQMNGPVDPALDVDVGLDSAEPNKVGVVRSRDQGTIGSSGALNIESRDGVNNSIDKRAVSNVSFTSSSEIEAEVNIGPQSNACMAEFGLLQPASQPTSTGILNHCVSATSIQATLSDSSQSLISDLGGPPIDEHIVLKQRIQTLKSLQLQEQDRHQRTEQIHQQLLLDLSRFSRELLHSVGDLTCAQAALDEASELTQLILKSAEIDAMDTMAESENSADVALKRKRMIAASCRGLAESKSMVEQGIKRIRALAADCVGITEFAQSQSSVPPVDHEILLATSADKGHLAPAAAMSAPLPLVIKTDLITRDPPTFTISPMTSTLMTPTVTSSALAPSSLVDQKLSSIFVDGIAFQEFEGHLATLRASLDSISKRIGLGRGVTRKLLSTSAASTLTGSITSSTLKLFTNSGIETTPFMKRVLTEDIYPCLLIHPKFTAAKQGGWMAMLLQSTPSTTYPTATSASAAEVQWSYGTNSQTPWFHRLLNAMERNSCEIEFWTTNQHHRTSILSAVHGQPLPQLTIQQHTPQNSAASTAAPKVACCLCSIVRPCEFRLRIVEEGEESSANNIGQLNDEQPTRSHTNNMHEDEGRYQPVDRFCRDRIVAVCDFYMFLAHLRQGLLDHQSNLELFRRALWLRQKMGCARIGSMDITQASLTAQLSNATHG
ncbi:hypothetical protein EDD11_010416 [Mortierella claussenii]|nr:hypothetical protein EDD11_010416 [Mortierella claussenii]